MIQFQDTNVKHQFHGYTKKYQKTINLIKIHKKSEVPNLYFFKRRGLFSNLKSFFCLRYKHESAVKIEKYQSRCLTWTHLKKKI